MSTLLAQVSATPSLVQGSYLPADSLENPLWGGGGVDPSPSLLQFSPGSPQAVLLPKARLPRAFFSERSPHSLPTGAWLGAGGRGPCPVLGHKAHPGLKAGWMGGVSAVGSTLRASPPKQSDVERPEGP